RRRACSAGRRPPVRGAAGAAVLRGTGPGATRTSRTGRAGQVAQRPPPPPPPPPPPAKPPPPMPELLPGGVDADAICDPSVRPTERVNWPMSRTGALPWYQPMAAVAAAAADAPTAAVKRRVQASSTPSATA